MPKENIIKDIRKDTNTYVDMVVRLLDEAGELMANDPHRGEVMATAALAYSNLASAAMLRDGYESVARALQRRETQIVSSGGGVGVRADVG